MELENFTTDFKHIAIEGVIGAGKTSLTLKLSKFLNARPVLEEFEENPFLDKFYDDIQHYAFQTQIFFLLSRFKQQQQLTQMDIFEQMIISDYMFEKDKIFAYLNLQDDELRLYESLVSLLEKSVPKPDLVVYLQCNVDHLMANIRKRGRKFERSISKEYIQGLNEAYNYFFFRYKSTPLLIVNADQIDFVNDENDFNRLASEILKPRKVAEYYNPILK
ncbi:MAG: deoxynucleoside kinase [Bacteroidetes bacterium]|jgi:deoxyadenosine/deoxycytidine kinase|nr:deoxynucleoside kinase [Bacteroidota bacterium]